MVARVLSRVVERTLQGPILGHGDLRRLLQQVYARERNGLVLGEEWLASAVLDVMPMTISAPRILMETETRSWHFAATVALLAAVFGLTVSPEFSLINIGFSLSAGLVSLLLKFKMPRGMLALWIALFAAVWLSPMSGLSADSKRLFFATALVWLSAAFQGLIPVYFIAVAQMFGVALSTLTEDLKRADVLTVMATESVLVLEIGIVIAVSLFWIRIAHSRSRMLYSSLKSTLETIEKTKTRTAVAHEGLQLTREMLLGRSHVNGEFAMSEIGTLGVLGSESEAKEVAMAEFDDLMAALRKAFSDFQARGRAEGRIAGPIRFVFFAPAAGYDEKSVIAVDIRSLTVGLEALFALALESLPEIGARKREGVIRLSIRYGLRVIEIAVEDNGRGLAARNVDAENSLNVLKDEIQEWGGKLDRIARLGVGSRTSLELRILREKTRAYRATLRHQTPIVSSPAGGGTRA